MKKLGLILIMFASLCFLLPAAGTQEETESTGTQSGTMGGDSTMYVTTDPLTLTIFLQDHWPFKTEYPVFQKAAEMTNVSLKGTIPQSNTDWEQAFNVMLASNEIADIVHSWNVNHFNNYGPEGAFLPLNDLIMEHAPNLKQFFFEEHPEYVRNSSASDRNLYYIPYIADGEAAKGWFIRKDWLDTLGLDVPKTVGEYYEALKAFKQQDPNGNGKEDEVPFFSRASAPITLAPLFGVDWEWYEEDGEVFHGKYTPEYKVAIENIAKWYSEGLIDQEIYTRGKKARDVLLGDDKGGSTHDWFGSTSSYNDKYKDTRPDFNFIPIAPPADINGNVWEKTARNLLQAVGWGMSVDNENPVETIKYFDFWFTEEGRRLANFGIEGEQYEMIDGKPIFKEEVLNGEKPVNQQLWEIGAQLAMGVQQDFSYELQWMNPAAKAGIEMYINNGYIIDQFPASLPFSEEESDVIALKWAAISSYMDEMEQKWILGNVSVDKTFDDYMDQLADMGMDEIILIYNQAYDRM
jgi:putative aldouronate transport system substrate-binding protein